MLGSNGASHSASAAAAAAEDAWLDKMISQYGESVLEKIVEEGLGPILNGSGFFGIDGPVEGPTALPGFSDPTGYGNGSQENCSETVKNVTLVARSLRKSHAYVLVSY